MEAERRTLIKATRFVWPSSRRHTAHAPVAVSSETGCARAYVVHFLPPDKQRNEEIMEISPIGTLHTPHTELASMPIQPKGAKEVEGRALLLPEYAEGLKDLEGFSHVYLIYHFHKATRTELTVVPFMDTRPRGVFSTRSPLRPAHIGISIVRVTRVEGNTLHFTGADMLDGTPLIDIKPYIQNFDQVEKSTSGWMTADEKTVSDKRSDDRFV